MLALGNFAREHGARSELLTRGEVSTPRALIAGWACREIQLSDGRRQIVSFLVPGDLIGVSLRPRQTASASVVALTPGATVDASMLRKAAAGDVGPHPDGASGLASALHASRSLEEALFDNQIVRLGRQTAYERIAHLLLELHHRLARVRMTDGDRFAVPLTQEIVGVALGLSSVHVNRTLQQLRRDGLLCWRDGVITLLRRDDLVEVADWSPPTNARAH